MPGGREQDDDLVAIKTALLNFIVTEIRGHAHELGPLSTELQATILAGVEESIGPSLNRFEAERLGALVERLTPIINAKLELLGPALSETLAEQLRKVAADAKRDAAEAARAVARSTVSDALQDTAVASVLASIRHKVSNLQTTLDLIRKNKVDEARASAEEGAQDAAKTDAGDLLLDQEEKETPEVNADLRPDPPNKRPWSKNPTFYLAVGGVTLVVFLGALAVLTRPAWLWPREDVPETIEQDQIEPVLSGIARDAESLQESFRAQAEEATATARLFGPGAEGDAARRVATRARGLEATAGALLERVRADSRAIKMLMRADGDNLPEAVKAILPVRRQRDYLNVQLGMGEKALADMERARERRKGLLLALAERTDRTLEGLPNQVNALKTVPEGETPAEKTARETDLKRAVAATAKSEAVGAAVKAAREAEDWQALWLAAGEAFKMDEDLKRIRSEPTPPKIGGNG